MKMYAFYLYPRAECGATVVMADSEETAWRIIFNEYAERGIDFDEWLEYNNSLGDEGFYVLETSDRLIHCDGH